MKESAKQMQHQQMQKPRFSNYKLQIQPWCKT